MLIGNRFEISYNIEDNCLNKQRRSRECLSLNVLLKKTVAYAYSRVVLRPFFGLFLDFSCSES